MRPEGSHLTLRLIAVAAVAFVAMCVVLLSLRGEAGTDERSALRDAPLGAAVVVPNTRPVTVPEARRSVTVTLADHTGQTELCGAGWVPYDGLMPPELSPELAARAEAATLRLASRLQGEADERSRAAGWLMQLAYDISHAGSGTVALQARCGNDRACIAEAERLRMESMQRASVPAANTLATLAATSRDPLVYAAAVRACEPMGSIVTLAPACQLISVEQWARVDPDNTVPWLNVATTAAARNDVAGVNEAMYRAAAASTSRVAGSALAGTAIAASKAVTGEFEQAQAFQSALSIVFDWQLPAYQNALHYCVAAALRDSNRLQACDALARAFIAHPSSLVEERIGFRIAERLGWPAEALSEVRAKSDAHIRAQQDFFARPEPLGCASVDRSRDYWLQVARDGEVAATRALAMPPATAATPYSAAPPPAR